MSLICLLRFSRYTRILIITRKFDDDDDEKDNLRCVVSVSSSSSSPSPYFLRAQHPKTELNIFTVGLSSASRSCPVKT